MPDFGMLSDTLVSPLAHNHAGAYYLICKDSNANYNCVNQKTGLIESVNSDAATVINYAITNVGLNGTIFLEAGTYVLSTSILVNQANVQICGAGFQETNLRAPTNAPCMIVSKSYCTIHDLYFVHLQAAYTSSTLQLILGANNCNFYNIDCYDGGNNIGNAIQLSNGAALNAGSGIFFNNFSNIFTSGFANAVHMVITNNGNYINANNFNTCVFDGCVSILKCVTTGGGGSTTNMDANNWTSIIGQSEVGNPMTVGFDYSDGATHNDIGHSSIVVFDLPATSTYLNVGSQTSGNLSFSLSSCYISDDTRIGGSGKWQLINSGNLLRDYAYGSQAQISPMFGKWGSAQPSGNTVVLDGLLNKHTVTSNTVGGTTLFNTTFGVAVQFDTAASSGVQCGYVSPTTGVGIGRLLFRGRMRSQFGNNTSATSARLYFGVTSNATLPISDTPLATTDSGIILGYNSTDTNYVVRTNNGGGGAATVTALTNTVAKDANVHILEINWIAGATTVNILLDNVLTTVSATLPATTTNLFFNQVVQTSAVVSRTLFTTGTFIDMGA